MLRAASAIAIAVIGFGCVGDPDGVLDPGWVQIEPGVGETIQFRDDAGPLNGVVLSIPPEAVSRPTAIRISVAEAHQPLFLSVGTGAQLHTPAVRIEPFNRLFNVPVELHLPWYSLGVTVLTEDLRAWSSDGAEGIPEGLWDATTVTGHLPGHVQLGIVRGGYYWAGEWDDDPLREAVSDVGSPCLEADSRLSECQADAACLATGCMHEICGSVTEVTSCLQSPAVQAKFGCRCRCASAVCQWVQ